MPIRTDVHPKIVTKDKDGKENGFLVPIYNIHEDFIPKERQPHQVYLTVAAPKTVKGPHLHMKRWGHFTCLKGNIKIVVKTEEGYEECYSGEDYEYTTIEVPAGVPSALQNIGDVDAYILNTPYPAWLPDDQDEYPVSFDDYLFTWK